MLIYLLYTYSQSIPYFFALFYIYGWNEICQSLRIFLILVLYIFLQGLLHHRLTKQIRRTIMGYTI